MAALGNAERVGERLRIILEDLGHFLGSLQIKLIPVIPEPLGVVHRLARPDAQQHVVRLEIGILQVMDIVGGDERQAQVFRDRLESGVDDELLVDTLVLHLEEEIARTENVAIRCRSRDGF